MENSLLHIDPYSFTGSAVLIGLILSNELSELEQSSVGNWLQLVGLTIQTYQSQKAVVDQKDQEQSSDLDTIKSVIDKIKAELSKLKESNL